GDAPLVRPELLARLATVHRESDAAVTLLTAELAPWTWSFGRVVRDTQGRVDRIVERTDATADELDLPEVNTSIYCFKRSVVAPALRRLSPENAQGEYYLTDIVEVLHTAGYGTTSLVVDDPMEAAGVNDRAQLAIAEAELRDRTNERWMRRGVTMVDPERTYIEMSVELSPDVTLFPGTFLQGNTVIAGGAEIGPDTRLTDCTIGESAIVEQTVGVQAEVGAEARVGPFAHLPPGSRVAPGQVTGPFFSAGVDT